MVKNGAVGIISAGEGRCGQLGGLLADTCGRMACSFFIDARASSIRVCASRVARHEFGVQLPAGTLS